MNITPRLTLDVTNLRAPLVADRRGNEVRDWDNATETAVKAAYWQATETEDNANRDLEESEQWLVEPAGTDLEATDRVRIGDDTYTVQGRPRRMRSFRREEFVLVKIKLVEG